MSPTPAQAVKFVISAYKDGFPFTVEIVGTVEQLDRVIERLKAIGATEPTPSAIHAVESEREREAPICQYHGPMKESTKRPGSFFCPKRMGDGSYCKEKYPA